MSTTTRPSARALVALAALSSASALLSVWQWMELLIVRAGGIATCSFSSTVDCAQVWDSDFASKVHGLTGLPIAGLGLQWSLTAFALSLWLIALTVQQRETVGLAAAVKVWGALGFLSCITFGVASARLGVLCPSCTLTYALTLGFAAAAFVGLSDGSALDFGALLKGLPRALVFAVPLHLALLYPASKTPKATGPTLAAHESGPTEAQVLEFFSKLSPQEAQITAEARAEWLKAPVLEYPTPATHQRYGPADAPVRVVEFTDVLCGHCRALVGMLNELKKAVPPGSLSIEPRYYPLDGECNPKLGNPRGDGVRCLGAKVQICLEGRPEFWEVRDQLFENQAQLDTEKLYALATSKGLSRPQLDACVADPKTAARLKEDIDWANAYEIDGTPLVLVNGRAEAGLGPHLGPFLFGLAMARGEIDNKYFAKLPAAR